MIRPAVAPVIAPVVAPAVALALFALGGPVVAAERLVDASKVFPRLEDYLDLPPAQRDQFTLAYTLKAQQPLALAAVKLAFVQGAARTPLALGADGRVARLPTKVELAGKLAVDTPAGVKMTSSMSVEPSAAPAREIAAPRLAAAVRQANDAVHKMAGALSLLAPSIDRVGFPGGEGGVVVGADGAKKPLPTDEDGAYFQPAAFPGAKAVVFERAPVHMRLGGKPKG